MFRDLFSTAPHPGISAPIQDVNIMDPPLLVRAWMMAHLYGAKVQAVVCYAGSSGEVAFRESLRAQYTSHRHDAKGLRYLTVLCASRLLPMRGLGSRMIFATANVLLASTLVWID